MNGDMLTEKGFRFVARGYKPLCGTEKGLLVYHKQALYLYGLETGFHKLTSFSAGMKEKLFCSNRILERMSRSEPQSALENGDEVFVARRHEVLQISLHDGRVISKHNFRKSYIHTNRLSVIRNVCGFSDSIVYGEYQPNAKRESVCIWRKKLGADCEWENVYSFPDGMIRHIHAIIPDSLHGCVYVLTGDEDKESGIWKATQDFSQVEPLAVGNQAFRSCVAYVEGDSLIYSTDIPSRQNAIVKLDLITNNSTTLFGLPGSSTLGCKGKDKMIFCTSVETEEPKSRGRMDMFRYLLGKKLPAGIKDRFPRVYVIPKNGKILEWLQFEKDFWPAGLFRFGRVTPVYDEYQDILFIYPGSVKKYDGKLYQINAEKISGDV